MWRDSFLPMDIGTIIFGIGAGLTWLIVILVLVQLSRFLAKFEQGRQELDSNIIGMAGQLKKLQTTVAEILIEQKRATRLMLEGLDLKKAEMTGDFEIVEEPVPDPLSPQSPVSPPPPISIPNQGGGAVSGVVQVNFLRKVPFRLRRFNVFLME